MVMHKSHRRALNGSLILVRLILVLLCQHLEDFTGMSISLENTVILTENLQVDALFCFTCYPKPT